MSFALWEIFLPLLLAALLGLIIGWLVWRWRRSLVSSAEWNKLSSAANASNGKIAELEAANAELTNERSSLSTKVTTLTGQYESTRTELGEVNLGSEKLTADLSARDAELAKLRSDLKARDGKLSGLEADLGTANTTIAGLRDLEGETKTLRGQVESSGKRIAELEAAAGETEAALKAAQDGRAEAEGKASASEAEISKLKAQLDGMSGEVSGRDGRIGELEAAAAAAVAATAATAAANKKSNDDLSAQLQQARGEVDASQARIADLDTELSTSRSELDGAHARIAELEGELGGAQTQISSLMPFETEAKDKSAQLDGAHARIAELEGQIGQLQPLQGQLDDANGRVDGANGRIAELEAQLGEMQAVRDQLDGANGRIAELEGNVAEMGQLRVGLTERDRRIEALEPAAQRADEVQGELDSVRAQLLEANKQVDNCGIRCDERDATIIDLRNQLEAKQAEADALPEPLRRVASFHAGSWKQGTTKLGTAGADHTDDLKVVSGIGPQMEKLLNSFDIISWEQLAALSDEEVATVDAALSEFPGRITRDEWVEQARAIMEAGHKPVERAPKPRPEPKKPEWQKGTTKLGTPGAGHSDDLKVINGIGPKMEKLLNSFDITAWEQLGALTASEVSMLDAALQEFPGRITRDEWVAQAKDLVKRFPDRSDRPDRKTFLNRSAATE